MPLDEYVQNLRTILQHVRGVGGNVTVLITPPPVFEPARLVDRQQKYGALADPEAERTNENTGPRGLTLSPAVSCRTPSPQLGCLNRPSS